MRTYIKLNPRAGGIADGAVLPNDCIITKDAEPLIRSCLSVGPLIDLCYLYYHSINHITEYKVQ